jgi:hypothetical protein
MGVLFSSQAAKNCQKSTKLPKQKVFFSFPFSSQSKEVVISAYEFFVGFCSGFHSLLFFSLAPKGARL